MKRTPSQRSVHLCISLCRWRQFSVVLLTGAAFILSPTPTAAQMPVQEWVRRYSHSGDDYPIAVAIDREGNVVVSGYSRGSGTGFDYATIKYSGAGVPLWTNRYDGPANATDVPHGLAVDSQGNVFATGYSLDIGVNKDYATVAYSSAGVALWTNRYNGPGNRVDEAYAVAVDAGGNVYVTGASDGGTSRFDYTTIAYSSTDALTADQQYFRLIGSTFAK